MPFFCCFRITELNASTSTIVNYLIGVTVGTLIFSVVVIIILGLPVFMDKSAKIQDFAVRKASWVVSLPVSACRVVFVSVLDFAISVCRYPLVKKVLE